MYDNGGDKTIKLFCKLDHKFKGSNFIFSASFTVICAKGVSSMIQLTFSGWNQLNKPILYVMVIVMLVSAVVQVK